MPHHAIGIAIKKGLPDNAKYLPAAKIRYGIDFEPKPV
jgi:hypothetical protein